MAKTKPRTRARRSGNPTLQPNSEQRRLELKRAARTEKQIVQLARQLQRAVAVADGRLLGIYGWLKSRPNVGELIDDTTPEQREIRSRLAEVEQQLKSLSSAVRNSVPASV